MPMFTRSDHANNARTVASRPIASLVHAPAAVGSATATWDALILQRELVVVGNFLTLGQVPHRKDNDMFRPIDGDDTRVRVRLQG